MNLALFLTKNNIGHASAIIRKMHALQTETVNGALVVLHDSTIPISVIRDAVAGLASVFKVSHLVPGQLNHSKSESTHISALFSLFMRTAYTRFPGAWMMFDELAEPKVANFMQEAAKQHGALGGDITARAIMTPGAALPVGPFVMNVPISLIKVLRYPTDQSWRDRGKFMFARLNFRLVPHDEWLFQASDNKIKDQLMPEKSDDLESFTNEELIDVITASGRARPHHFTGRDKLLALAKEATLQPA